MPVPTETNALLESQERAWNARPLLRRLYGDWFRLVASRLAGIDGDTVELGAGIGRFKETVPAAIATDVEQTAWADDVVDAEAMPYDEGSLANLVLIDVFHHLARPARFFDEAARTLSDGGRVVILDPYCSPLSTPAYRFFHHERTDLGADPLADDTELSDSPLASNQARATLVFFRALERFRTRWPMLAPIERKRLELLLYPLSGGFSRPQVLPASLYRPLRAVEGLLRPLTPLCAFRCLVVLERTPR